MSSKWSWRVEDGGEQALMLIKVRCLRVEVEGTGIWADGFGHGSGWQGRTGWIE